MIKNKITFYEAGQSVKSKEARKTGNYINFKNNIEYISASGEDIRSPSY